MSGIKRINRGRGHSYTINGTKAYGVTTALSEGLPKPALMSWGAKCAAEEAWELLWAQEKDEVIYDQQKYVNHLRNAPNRRRDTAAVRGTKIHGYAEKIIRGEKVEVPQELVPPVEQVVRFLDQWKVRPLLVEHTVGNYKWMYAGTFDLIGELPDGRRVLFDYKTGASGIWPDAALQLAAYQWADAYIGDDGTEMPMREIGVTEAKAVWIRSDGYDVIPLQTDFDVFRAFLYVLGVARFRQVMDGWKGEAELPNFEDPELPTMEKA